MTEALVAIAGPSVPEHSGRIAPVAMISGPARAIIAPEITLNSARRLTYG